MKEKVIVMGKKLSVRRPWIQSWQPADTVTSHSVLVRSIDSSGWDKTRSIWEETQRREQTRSRHTVLDLTGMMSQLRIWVGMTTGGLSLQGILSLDLPEF